MISKNSWKQSAQRDIGYDVISGLFSLKNRSSLVKFC